VAVGAGVAAGGAALVGTGVHHANAAAAAAGGSLDAWTAQQPGYRAAIVRTGLGWGAVAAGVGAGVVGVAW
ncbi:MAG: hypothetical protein ABMB14_14435, partial [Myxococcota bacterium]